MRSAFQSVLWKRFTAKTITARPRTSRAVNWGQSTSKPMPFRNMPRMTIEHVAQGIEETEPLDNRRHVGDREDEPGEQHGREKEEEGRHHRLLLGLAHGGDEQSDAERAQQEQETPSSSRAKLPRNGMPNQNTPTSGDERDVEEADHDERRTFAEDELHRPDGRDHDLLDRADLLLAHDGHAREHKADEHDHQRDHARHEIVRLSRSALNHARGGDPRSPTDTVRPVRRIAWSR